MIKWADYQDKYRNFRLERTDDGVLTVTFGRDGQPIVWGFEPLEELGDLWTNLAADRDNQVVIVTGSGDAFTPTMVVPESVRMSASFWDKTAGDVKRMINGHLNIPVPMIAAVNGPAWFHSEQALLCDIVIASGTAQFRDCPHFISGMAPGDGVQIIYTHLLGANRARYFLFMGEAISAPRALELGLVSEVLAPEKLLDRAKHIAQHLLKQPELVRRYTRQVTIEPIRRLYSQFLDHGLGLEGLGAWERLEIRGR